MKYTLTSEEHGSVNLITVSDITTYIPIDSANRHYQEVLDAIIEQGADCFDGDIPAELQAAADAKQGNN